MAPRRYWLTEQINLGLLTPADSPATAKADEDFCTATAPEDWCRHLVVLLLADRGGPNGDGDARAIDDAFAYLDRLVAIQALLLQPVLIAS
jgi:hypothetical protein